MSPTLQDNLLAVVLPRIVDAFQPLRVVLFGSRARGDARDDSDLDLLVVMPFVVDKRRTAIDIRVALRDLPVAKDVIVTTPEELAARGNAPGSILRAALEEGISLFERN